MDEVYIIKPSSRKNKKLMVVMGGGTWSIISGKQGMKTIQLLIMILKRNLI